MAESQGSAARLLEVAMAEEGYVEGPKDNETKYGKFTGANFLPWCGSFVNWCADVAGVKMPNTVSTPAGAQAFIKAGAWQKAEEATPMPGDIAYFDFPNDGIDRISHVGIVIKDNGDGTVTCIEGNTTKAKKGDQRNGGEVCVQIRAYKKKNGSKVMPSKPVTVVGFGRPAFGKAVPSKIAAAKAAKKEGAKPAKKAAKKASKKK